MALKVIETVRSLKGYVQALEAVLQQMKGENKISSYSSEIFEQTGNFRIRIDFEIEGRKVYRSEEYNFLEDILRAPFVAPTDRINELIASRIRGEKNELFMFKILKENEGKEILPDVTLLSVSRATKKQDEEDKADLVLNLIEKRVRMVFDDKCEIFYQVHINVKSSIKDQLRHREKYPRVPSLVVQQPTEPKFYFATKQELLKKSTKIIKAMLGYENILALGKFLNSSDPGIEGSYGKNLNELLKKKMRQFHQ